MFGVAVRLFAGVVVRVGVVVGVVDGVVVGVVVGGVIVVGIVDVEVGVPSGIGRQRDKTKIKFCENKVA